MQAAYADGGFTGQGRKSWMDQARRLPMIGFVVGTTLSLMLWGMIGLSALTLF